MAFKKFDSLEEAVAAGFTVILGNNEYAEGGEQMSRAKYFELFRILGAHATVNPPMDIPFELPKGVKP